MARVDAKLRELVEAAGSAAALARLIDLNPTTVQRALRRGVSPRSTIGDKLRPLRAARIRSAFLRQEREQAIAKERAQAERRRQALARREERRLEREQARIAAKLERERAFQLVYQRELREAKKRARAETRARNALLKELKRNLGTPESVALLLGVRPATVRVWQRAGVPLTRDAGQRLENAVRVMSDAADPEKQAENLAMMLDFMGEHERHDDLPAIQQVKSQERAYEGEKTTGYLWAREYGRILTPDMIAVVEAWLMNHRSASRSYGWWQVLAMTSTKGRAPLTGSPVAQPLQVKGRPEMAEFRWNVKVPSHRSRTLAGAVASVIRLLVASFHQDTVVYLHGVTLRNWRYWTDEERRARATRQRKARRKQ